MADAPQVFDVPLSPTQRFVLFNLAFGRNAPEVKDAAAGKSFRRAVRAFGLMPVREAMTKHNRVSVAVANRKEPALHKITIENIGVALEKWATMPRHTSWELEVGELFDMLEEIKAAPAAYATPSGMPVYVEEDWAPAPDPEPEGPLTCPSCRQTFDFSEAKVAGVNKLGSAVEKLSAALDRVQGEAQPTANGTPAPASG
jgi:hypothetical protein